LVFGVAYIVLHFTRIEAPSNMQKRAFEDAIGYSNQGSDSPSPGFPQSPYAQNTFPQPGATPTYPPTNYTGPGAV
jgi:hypothetical protein